MLRKNDDQAFTCPVKLCLHADFKSSRGLRKHIDNKHAWYYYFDEQPEVKREEIEMEQPAKKKVCTSQKPAFSLENGIGKTFLAWLCTSCGGGKSEKEATQIGKRAMKFLMESLGNNESDNDLTYEFVDCCLSSASIFISFLQTLSEEWKISSSASLNYVKAIGDLVDFRKASGLPDNTLRCFTVTEVYLRRAKENLRKKKNIECNRNLDLETLIAKDSWASIEEMEKVIPFHIDTFKRLVEGAKAMPARLSRRDLVFCTRFITTMLFLRVKCSRPMSYQFLTVPMIHKAKENNGFIDQTEFKTASKYIFDTLIITDDVMYVLELYIDHIRPRLDPKCNFLLLSTNGTQFQSLTTAMTMLVHEAIGKYINPTRYRQIIETEGSDRLSHAEQQILSEDQKHSSRVAQIHYKKKQSRRVAEEGKKCMEKMTKGARAEPGADIMQVFGITNRVDSHFDKSVLERSKRLCEIGESSSSNEENATNSFNPYEPQRDLDSSMDTDLVIASTDVHATQNFQDVLIKKEIVNLTGKHTGKNVKFSKEEDKFLKDGILKYGKSWASILKDKDFCFHSSRKRDALRMRAESVAFKKYFKTYEK